MNKYNCPNKLWSKFSATGKKVYNDVMMQALNNKHETLPLGHVILSKFLTDSEFEVISYNFACYAAWAADRVAKKKIIKV